MPSKPVAVHKFTCLVDGCNKSYDRLDRLQRHVDYIHNKIYRNVCDHINEKGVKCVFKCEQPGNLERHKRQMHSDVRGHQCTDCTMAFKEADHLKVHCVAKHSADNDPARTEYKCGMCNHEGFVTSGELKRHCLRKHGPKDDPKLAALRKTDADSKCRSRLKKRAKESAGGAPSAFGKARYST
ncbi:hypothetical protein T484DRAFT_1862887 [Baffinella frigidus]|nr:hypothetical protein T484DRAFT_1862887 [Cryptophyta sp. CCMP2293]